ncbi:Heat shock protein [Sparassis crispa]|uniref:Heat shock protein n=1 Tax=Sparassis crispa TaxID=139825 RepID=A0A401GQU7_9APHY|nr:Heat shock protein [Sparassis crispa]GBE84539.1 Heat shock protein [Sparassis crispa]
MPSDTHSDGLGQNDFTANALDVLPKSTDVAVKVHSSEVKPVHMMLVLLCGKAPDLDNINMLSVPEPPPLLWAVVSELDGNPLQLAQDVKKFIVSAPRNTPLLAPPTPPPGAKEPSRIGRLFRGDRSRGRHSPSPSVTNLQAPAPPPTTVASDALVDVITRARNHKKNLGDDFVSPYHLLLGLSDDSDVLRLLETQHITQSEFQKELRNRRTTKVTEREDDQFPYLAKYSTDMTALARDGKLNEIVGRDEEIRRVIQILCRRTKNSAVLIGEPGVGKTAVAEGLAYRTAFGQVPQNLKGTIYSLDLGAVFAGAGKGEYEQRVKGIIEDVTRSQESQTPAILFIDELHLITVGKNPGGQSSGMDAANLLKPALARGQFRCIGATTLAEYREHIEKDGALERRFAPVIVSEPTTEEAVTILRGIRERYEQHHRVWIMDQAIVTAVNLAHRFLTARRLPDSAVDLMDEACASARIAQDMKPEAIDTLQQDMLHVAAHIKALERDNHPDDDVALANALETKKKLDLKMGRLLQQQEAVRAWWKKISIQRSAIQDKKREVLFARSEQRQDTSKILKLESTLQKLRDGLVRLEHQGPNVVDDTPDLVGSSRHIISRTSPDIITPESIAAIVEKATKIPVSRLLATDKSRLLNLESALSQQVVGQPEAVKAVTHAIQVSRTGLGNTNRPIASLLFTGPSGTGKTLLSKVLAQELFGQSSSMVRIDGSEYSQSHSTSRLIGSPPGYVGYDQGGQLTEFVRRTPYCIVLLDEIEKTCPEFLTLFLQVLDEGRLTDGQGRLVDFRNTVIIMTSNVGADLLSAEKGEISDATRKKVMDRFKEIRFPVEFLNRIEEIIMFRTMTQSVMEQILEKHLSDLQQREGIKRLRLNIDRKAKTWLIKIGISREYGARPLARVIQRELLNPLSQRLLEETIHEGDTVRIILNESQDGLYVMPNHDAPPPSELEPVAESSTRAGKRRML